MAKRAETFRKNLVLYRSKKNKAVLPKSTL